MNKKEIVVNDRTENNNSPINLLAGMIQQNWTAEQINTIMDAQERWEANNARKAYHLALSEFKKNVPEIGKNKQGYGYKYASWANILDKITPPLSDHGFSLNHREFEQPSDGKIKVTCFLTHKFGHSEQVSISAMPEKIVSKEGKNVMNNLQSIGTAITYLKRYTAMALLGIEADDIDNDGASEEEKISEEEVIHLESELKSIDANMEGFLKFMKVLELSKINKSDYQKALNLINAKKINAKKNTVQK